MLNSFLPEQKSNFIHLFVASVKFVNSGMNTCTVLLHALIFYY